MHEHACVCAACCSTDHPSTFLPLPTLCWHAQAMQCSSTKRSLRHNIFSAWKHRHVHSSTLWWERRQHAEGISELAQNACTSQEEWRGEIVQLSWQPRSYQLKGFLTDKECERLIKLAKPGMRKSSVADSKTGQSIASEVRTSTGTFLAKHADDVVARIERRVAQVRTWRSRSTGSAAMQGAHASCRLLCCAAFRICLHPACIHIAVCEPAAGGWLRLATARQGAHLGVYCLESLASVSAPCTGLLYTVSDNGASRSQ